MIRRFSIRKLFDKNHRRFPDSYIAVQSGEFVHFLFAQAVEISSLMGEPLDRNASCSTIQIHRLAFEAFVKRLHYIRKVPVVWVERMQDNFGYSGSRIVKTIVPA